MCYSKPFLTYEQQIDKLKNEYGLIINNNEFAKELLSTISYYDLINGYKDVFLRDSKVNFNIEIELLFSIYILDREFQNIFLKYSLIAENSFKTSFAYTLGKNFGVHENEYLNKSNFIIKDEKSRTAIKRMHETYKGNFIKNPTRHYAINKNHIPPWILFKNAKFNDVILLYSILNSEEKNEVALNYFNNDDIEIDEQKEILKTALTIIKDYRNIMAHNLKFVTYKPRGEFVFKDIMGIKKVRCLINWNDKKTNLGKRDIFSLILALTILLNNRYLSIKFTIELFSLINSYKNLLDNQNITLDYYYAISKLPKDLDSRLEKLINYLK